MVSRKGTTVRAQIRRAQALDRWARLGRWLARFSERLAATLLTWLYLRPPPRRRSKLREQLVLDTAQRFQVTFQDTSLRVWRWGRGPLVLLVHGWGGNAGQLQGFVQPLLRGGFSVVAFDAPAHGVSGGRWASLTRFAAAIAHVAQTLGPVHALIAHSLGGAAAGLAISRGLHVERLIEIGPPADALAWFRSQARALGLGEGVERIARSQVERRLGVGFDRLNPEAIGPGVDTPALVIHDRLDREVPWFEGARVAKALPHATLMTTLGLGHSRILVEPAVIDAAQRFLETNRPVPAVEAQYGSSPAA
jgi:pimeloyl-ACP methyl ester carboxylesterase